MSKYSANDRHFFATACYFEFSLLALSAFMGWLMDINPFARLFFSETAIALGIIGVIPLFLLFIASQYSQQTAMRTIKQRLLDTFCPYLSGRHWTDLLLLAVSAGLGEEILFRGLLQPWLETLTSVPIALVISNTLFGLLHAITPMYALIAGCVGTYLGLSMDLGAERNLLIPIIIHSLYDFLAFLVLMRTYRLQQPLN